MCSLTHFKVCKHQNHIFFCCSSWGVDIHKCHFFSYCILFYRVTLWSLDSSVSSHSTPDVLSISTCNGAIYDTILDADFWARYDPCYQTREEDTAVKIFQKRILLYTKSKQINLTIHNLWIWLRIPNKSKREETSFWRPRNQEKREEAAKKKGEEGVEEQKRKKKLLVVKVERKKKHCKQKG